MEIQWSPFPINRALRAMEEKLFTELGVKEEATVLDGGVTLHCVWHEKASEYTGLT
jgi:hypothetical protein